MERKYLMALDKARKGHKNYWNGTSKLWSRLRTKGVLSKRVWWLWWFWWVSCRC